MATLGHNITKLAPSARMYVEQMSGPQAACSNVSEASRRAVLHHPTDHDCSTRGHRRYLICEYVCAKEVDIFSARWMACGMASR